MKNLLVLVLLLALGCSQTGSQQEPEIGETVESDIMLASQVRQHTAEVRGVEESAAVVIGNDVSVGIRVTGFNRFRLQSIRQEVHAAAREVVPDEHQVHVTSDKRLYANLARMEQTLSQSEGMASPQTQRDFRQINRDMQG